MQYFNEIKYAGIPLQYNNNNSNNNKISHLTWPGRFTGIAGNAGNHGNDGKFHKSHQILSQI